MTIIMMITTAFFAGLAGEAAALVGCVLEAYDARPLAPTRFPAPEAN